MQTSDCVNDLAAALAAFHSQVSNPENTRTATIEGETKAGKPFSYSYGYSDLSGITDATRRHLADNGLSVTQELIVDGERIGARLRLLHSSGQWIEYEPVWMPAGGGPKDWGAAATYSRRFGVSAVLYLATAGDDDARSAAKGATRGREAGASARQVAKIKAEAERAHISEQSLRADLRATYQLAAPDGEPLDEALTQLTIQTASGLIDRLMAEADRRAAAAAAGADPATGEVPERQIDDDPPGHTAATVPWKGGAA